MSTVQTAASRPTPPLAGSKRVKVLPLVLLSMGISGTLLAQKEEVWSRLAPWVRNSSRQLVARLEEIKPPVRARALGEFSWTDLGRSAVEVRDGDTLYTSHLGNGLLRYPDGLGILIRGDSLVRIEAARQKGVRRILLSEGETEIRFGASSGPVELVAGNRVVKVLSSAMANEESIITTRFTPRERGRNLEIRHERGATVKVETRDLQAQTAPTPMTELKANTVLAIESTRGVTTARVLASAPSAIANPAPASAPTNAGLAAAPTPAAPAPTKTQPVPSKAAARPPASKTIVMAPVQTRTKTIPAKKAASARLEKVSSEGSTQLGANKSTAVINVGLQWGAIPGAKQYGVQVFDDTGKTMLKKQVSQPTMEFDLPSIDYTDLEYQVDALLQDGSQVSSGRLALKIKITAPIPVLPQPGSTFTSGETTILSWEKVAGAPSYEVSVVLPGRKPASAQTEIMTENFLLFTPPDPGRYTWKVRAVGRKVRGPWSDLQKFESTAGD